MLQGSNVSRNSNYLVPCVFKAVQMIEALRRVRTGLRVEDLRSMTGYSRTTIYRILRTLAACGYIVRNSRAIYRLNYSVVSVAVNRPADEQDCGTFVPDVKQRHAASI